MPFKPIRVSRLAAGIFAAASFAITGLAAASCLAHAFLDHAVPSVGGSVAASPGELDLSFTQEVVVALSRVTLARADGGAVPAGRATGEGGSSSPVLHVRLGKPLVPGGYVVTWHVVSVDTHPTSGSYKFTVAP